MVENNNKEIKNDSEKANIGEQLNHIASLEHACKFSTELKKPLYFDNYAWNKEAFKELVNKRVNPEVLSLLLTPENNLKWEEIKRIYEDDPVSTLASLSLAVDKFEQRRWKSEHYPPPFTPNEERLMFAGYRFLTELPEISDKKVLSEFRKRIRNQIVLCNSGLVKKWAKRLYGKYNDVVGGREKTDSYFLDDLISAGHVAVIKAIDNFKLEKGNLFSTYARRCIINKISDEIGEYSLIRIPCYLRNSFTRYAKYYSELTQKYKRLPTYEEVSKYAKLKGKKIPKKSVITSRKKQVNPIELDSPAFHYSNIDFYDITPSRQNTEREVIEKLMKSYLKEKLPDTFKTLRNTISIEQYTAFLMKYQIEKYLESGLFNILTDEETGKKLSITLRSAQYRREEAQKNFAVIAQLEGLHDCL